MVVESTTITTLYELITINTLLQIICGVFISNDLTIESFYDITQVSHTASGLFTPIRKHRNTLCFRSSPTYSMWSISMSYTVNHLIEIYFLKFWANWNLECDIIFRQIIKKRENTPWRCVSYIERSNVVLIGILNSRL